MEHIMQALRNAEEGEALQSCRLDRGIALSYINAPEQLEVARQTNGSHPLLVAATVAKGLELLFGVDVLLLCLVIVWRGEEMLGIWIIVIIIYFYTTFDAKAELTQVILSNKKWCFTMSPNMEC
eukprot:15354632-Ditylum_brightwellii.AAC.1